jgi:hypothetical protein
MPTTKNPSSRAKSSQRGIPLCSPRLAFPRSEAIALLSATRFSQAVGALVPPSISDSHRASAPEERKFSDKQVSS